MPAIMTCVNCFARPECQVPQLHRHAPCEWWRCGGGYCRSFTFLDLLVLCSRWPWWCVARGAFFAINRLMIQLPRSLLLNSSGQPIYALTHLNSLVYRFLLSSTTLTGRSPCLLTARPSPTQATLFLYPLSFHPLPHSFGHRGTRKPFTIKVLRTLCITIGGWGYRPFHRLQSSIHSSILRMR